MGLSWGLECATPPPLEGREFWGEAAGSAKLADAATPPAVRDRSLLFELLLAREDEAYFETVFRASERLRCPAFSKYAVDMILLREQSI